MKKTRAVFCLVMIIMSLSYVRSGLAHRVVSERSGAFAAPAEIRIRLEKPPSLDELLQRNAPAEEIAAALMRYYELKKSLKNRPKENVQAHRRRRSA